MELRVRRLLIGVLLWSYLCGAARADLRGRIDRIINSSSQRKVKYGAVVVKAGTGEVVYGHNSRRAMLPASNMKLVVSAAAVRELGGDYEFKTKAGLCGDTLVVIGGGDPLLGDEATDGKYGRKAGWIFDDIARRVKKKGLEKVKDIVIDSTIFDDERVHPSWPREQLNRDYACEVSGVNYNGNCVDIRAETVGGQAAVFVEPQTGYVEVTNKVKAIGSGKGAIGSYRGREANKITVFGKCRGAEGPFAVAIERPAAFFGFLLAERLAREGIKTEGELLVKGVGEGCRIRPFAEYASGMGDVLGRCNKDSFGLAAEALVKTIGAKRSGGRNGSWTGGREAVGEYLRRLGAGAEEFFIDDGSGLSRKNKLSANLIAKVLLDMYNSGDWQVYKNSLAVGGADGTIGKYFREGKYKGRIFGKTGYIAGVKSFSGVCNTKSGEYIFSVLTEKANGQTRGAINNIAEAIVDEFN